MIKGGPRNSKGKPRNEMRVQALATPSVGRLRVVVGLTPSPTREFERDDFRNIFHGTRAHGLQRPRTTSPSVTNMTVWVYSRYASVSVFRSARALSRHGPWTATSTFAPIEWSVIVPGAGVGRTKKPKMVRHHPTTCGEAVQSSPYRLCASASCCGNMLLWHHELCLLT